MSDRRNNTTYAMPDLDGNGQVDTVTVPSTGNDQERMPLYGANGEQLDFSRLFPEDQQEQKQDPFESSYLDHVTGFLAQHGPAIGKVFLIIATAAATIYNAMKASAHEDVLAPRMIFTILAFCGLIVECGFAYGWSVRGEKKLAGKQVKTADQMFKRSAATMVGDLVMSIAEVGFGLHGIGQLFIGFIQPVVAVHVVFLWYRLKGEHPQAIADQKIYNLQAWAAAEEAEDQAQQWQLVLDDRKHHRLIQRRADERRHEKEWKLVNSWWYGRQLTTQVNEQVGKKLLGDGLRKKLSGVTDMLRLKPAQKN